MAITGLVLGIVAIATSFLPIINNVSFFIGLVGIVLAIVGIVGTGKGKKKGRGLAIAGLIIGILSVIVVLGSQAFYVSVIDQAFDSAKATPAASGQSSSAGDAASGTTTTESAYGLSIDKVVSTTDYSGKQAVVADFTFTNNSTDEATFAVAINCKAFQNGVQLESTWGSWDSENSLKSIKPGGSLTVQKGFLLDDTSPVTIEASETFDFSNELLVQETYNVE